VEVAPELVDEARVVACAQGLAAQIFVDFRRLRDRPIGHQVGAKAIIPRKWFAPNRLEEQRCLSFSSATTRAAAS